MNYVEIGLVGDVGLGKERGLELLVDGGGEIGLFLGERYRIRGEWEK